MKRAVVQDTHREQCREQDNLREDHGPIRGADGGAWCGDVGERKGDTGDRDAPDRRRSHRGERTEPDSWRASARITRIAAHTRPPTQMPTAV